MQKAVMFIDGANIYACAKSIGLDIDYSSLYSYFEKQYFILHAYYYTALRDNDEYRSIQPLVDWLDYNKYIVVSKEAKEYTNERGYRKTKGNMDVELVIDAVKLIPHMDVMILFSGDGDFRKLVEYVQEKGVYVICISQVAPTMIADELRRQVDKYIDLDSLRPRIEKKRE